jgi:CubicO group peptidase (beta-lactamase class C family)
LDQSVGRILPEQVGVCSTRFRRLSETIRSDVEAGRIPGAVVLVARSGRPLTFEAFGSVDPDTKAAMRPDSIFRLASLTKPITSVATMMLVERGDLSLDNTLGQHIPELSQARSLCDGGLPVAIHDLLRHTAGFTYGEFGSGPAHESYRRMDVLDSRQSSDDFIRKLAQAPLAFAPGTTFEYGVSTDVLGCVIERILSDDLESIFNRLIFAPLGLGDTSFLLPEGASTRLAQPFRDPDTGQRPWLPTYRDSEDRPNWYSGGGGLLSTARDYFIFLQTLLDDLLLGRGRLLGRKTLAWMTSNHLPLDVAYGEYMSTLGLMAPLPERGQGFGLGFLVRIEPGRNSVPGSVGEFSWAGTSGTYAWVDPAEHLVCVFMMQAPNERIRYRALTRQLVYQALLKKPQRIQEEVSR